MQRCVKHLVPSRDSPGKRAVGRAGLLHIVSCYCESGEPATKGWGVGGRRQEGTCIVTRISIWGGWGGDGGKLSHPLQGARCSLVCYLKQPE